MCCLVKRTHCVRIRSNFILSFRAGRQKVTVGNVATVTVTLLSLWQVNKWSRSRSSPLLSSCYLLPVSLSCVSLCLRTHSTTRSLNNYFPKRSCLVSSLLSYYSSYLHGFVITMSLFCQNKVTNYFLEVYSVSGCVFKIKISYNFYHVYK